MKREPDFANSTSGPGSVARHSGGTTIGSIETVYFIRCFQKARCRKRHSPVCCRKSESCKHSTLRLCRKLPNIYSRCQERNKARKLLPRALMLSTAAPMIEWNQHTHYIAIYLAAIPSILRTLSAGVTGWPITDLNCAPRRALGRVGQQCDDREPVMLTTRTRFRCSQDTTCYVRQAERFDAPGPRAANGGVPQPHSLRVLLMFVSPFIL